ncbi:MAG: IS1595 family transposase [Candidatus Izemoplasmatales bacterium]|jgi:transposase-like protein|nr:IS1595 family transposase [Rhodospirillaceae bacterium]
MSRETMTETILPIINALCADEYNDLLKTMNQNQQAINEAADALHKILFRERKQSDRIARYGKSARGRQRYIDLESGKTFSDSDQSIVRYTKKTYAQWHSYIKYMLYGLSLREIAFEVGISVTTAFNWRHKILSAMKEYQEEQPLSGEIQMDETYFLLNMKGPWKKKQMPRKAKKRGTRAVQRGLSNEYVCVLVGLDETDKVLSEIVGQGNPLGERMHKALKGRVKPESLIVSDSRSAYQEISSKLKCELIQIPTGHHGEGMYNLGSINQYHSELKNWYSRFKGVSTKHLEGYLVWFRFMKLLQYQTEYENRSIELMNYTISNKVSIKNQDICRKPFPIDIFKPYQHLS